MRRIYLKLRKTTNIDLEQFYKDQKWRKPLLLTKAGEPYKSLFDIVKIRYLLDSAEHVKELEDDNVVPKEWIQTGYKEFWHYSLQVRQAKDLG